jgi:hypothetical protein
MVPALDLANQLEKQLRFLETSCREYDTGNLDEAIRIATALRVIFHHTASSTSLLVHLAASSTRMLSTCGTRKSDDPRGYWLGFIKVSMDVGKQTLWCEPLFSTKPSMHRVVPFTAWWDSETVYFGGGRKIRRKTVVLDAANKDGGAHIDAHIPGNYQFFLDGAEFSFSVDTVNGSRTDSRLVNVHLACLRQIAHEVFNSPEILKLAGRT